MTSGERRKNVEARRALEGKCAECEEQSEPGRSRCTRHLERHAKWYRDQRAGARGSQMIAALFVAEGGCYFGLPDVDPWSEARDARLYAGPHPVVAHPPCQLWVNFAALNFKRYGGEHNRPGNDAGAFASALASVRRWGGVLEHPASSNAWAAHDLPAPAGRGWQACQGGGWVAEVWQSAYGHRARKRTWLFAVTADPPLLDRRAPAGSAQVGWQFVGANCRGEVARKPPLSKREASATPPAFRDLLLSIARSARAAERAA